MPEPLIQPTTENTIALTEGTAITADITIAHRLEIQGWYRVTTFGRGDRWLLSHDRVLLDRDAAVKLLPILQAFIGQGL